MLQTRSDACFFEVNGSILIYLAYVHGRQTGLFTFLALVTF